MEKRNIMLSAFVLMTMVLSVGFVNAAKHPGIEGDDDDYPTQMLGTDGDGGDETGE